MNRAQFMEQLEKLLSDISEEERQEALDYYESYFDDAGEDQEANVIRELGSPGKVAAIIKADLKESSQNYGEYTENGFQDDRVKEDMQMPEQRGSRAERGYLQSANVLAHGQAHIRRGTAREGPRRLRNLPYKELGQTTGA